MKWTKWAFGGLSIASFTLKRVEARQWRLFLSWKAIPPGAGVTGESYDVYISSFSDIYIYYTYVCVIFCLKNI
jgi:hypothetical protein